MRYLTRFKNWLLSLFDIHLNFDGDLMAPSGDEPWWK